MKTYWYCEQCQQVAWSNHETDADVMSVAYEIEADHHRLKPECNNPIRQIRIINLKLILASQLPDYVVDMLVDRLVNHTAI